MNNLQMFCITLEPSHVKFIKNLSYVPVVLGEKNYTDDCFGDKTGENISKKNKFYGEYTFHYWLWKNYFDNLDEKKWIGFCQYRKFWSLEEIRSEELSLKKLENTILKNVPDEFDKYDVILGKPFYINQRRTMKFLKKGFKLIISNPKFLFSEKSRNIKFHFDLMHGKDNLIKAIELLDDNNKVDFKNFVNNEQSFNPHNMFICKSKSLLIRYYQDIFKWLNSCEKIFGFENLKGYGMTRIYGFLAERFMSYWFKKNSKFIEIPILFYDINNELGN
tara:strand:+ start:135 stop:962 length:828 start_codon:yes stop_codon:yes gene_type:complete